MPNPHNKPARNARRMTAPLLALCLVGAALVVAAPPAAATACAGYSYGQGSSCIGAWFADQGLHGCVGIHASDGYCTGVQY